MLSSSKLRHAAHTGNDNDIQAKSPEVASVVSRLPPLNVFLHRRLSAHTSIHLLLYESDGKIEASFT